MTNNPQTMYIFFTGIAGLAQFGALLLNIDSKSKLWKRGIYVGMIGSAFSVGGFLAQDIELYPCLCFVISMAIMLCCVVYSYYAMPLPDSYTDTQREDRAETKRHAVQQLGLGLLFTIVLTAYASYQGSGQRVQIGFAGVLYRLADEVKQLHEAVTTLTLDVKQLKIQAKVDALADSLARKKNFSNQEQMKKQLNRRR